MEQVFGSIRIGKWIRGVWVSSGKDSDCASKSTIFDSSNFGSSTDFFVALRALVPVTGGVFTGGSFADGSFADVPFADVPFADVPFADVPFADVPFADVPFADVPFADGSFADVPFADVPFVAEALLVDARLAGIVSFSWHLGQEACLLACSDETLIE